MEKIKNNPLLLTYGLLGVLALIWGSSFLLIKKALIAFSWDQVAALRVSITMVWFLPLVYQQFKKIEHKRDYFYIFLMGLFGNAIPAFLFPVAQTHIDSSLAGILNSLTPISVLLFGAVFFNTSPTKNKIFGVLLGVTGALFLILFGQQHQAGSNNWYALFVLLATFCYAISSNVIKEYLQNLKAVTSTALAFFMIGPLALVYLFSTDFMEVMQTDSNAWFSLGSVGLLATFGTAIATLLYVKLVQLTSAVLSSMVTYLIPIVALILGFFDGESITIWHGVGIILILVGVYLAQRAK